MIRNLRTLIIEKKDLDVNKIPRDCFDEVASHDIVIVQSKGKSKIVKSRYGVISK